MNIWTVLLTVSRGYPDYHETTSTQHLHSCLSRDHSSVATLHWRRWQCLAACLGGLARRAAARLACRGGLARHGLAAWALGPGGSPSCRGGLARRGRVPWALALVAAWRDGGLARLCVPWALALVAAPPGLSVQVVLEHQRTSPVVRLYTCPLYVYCCACPAVAL